MSVVAPEQIEVPGYAGLAIGGVLATFGSLGYLGPETVSLPRQLTGSLLAIISIGYFLVLFWIAAAFN